MSNSVLVEFCLMSSVASNRCPFITYLSLGNRKKSRGARSGKYGGCCNWTVPCLAKNCCTRCEVCAGALSWCRIQSPSRHFSGRFGRTELTEIPHRKNRYDINARVNSATYYSQLSKRSHLQLVSRFAKTRTNMSRLVANTSHPVNNHYSSNLDTIWTNLV